MKDDNPLRRQWLALRHRLTASVGHEISELEMEAMFPAYCLGALTWNQLLVNAADDAAARKELWDSLGELALTMSQDTPTGRVM